MAFRIQQNCCLFFHMFRRLLIIVTTYSLLLFCLTTPRHTTTQQIYNQNKNFWPYEEIYTDITLTHHTSYINVVYNNEVHEIFTNNALQKCAIYTHTNTPQKAEKKYSIFSMVMKNKHNDNFRRMIIIHILIENEEQKKSFKY